MTSITSSPITKTKVDKIKINSKKKNNPRISDVDIHNFHVSLAKEVVTSQPQTQTQTIPSSSQSSAPPIMDEGAIPSRPKARKRKSTIEQPSTENHTQQPILPIPQPSTSTSTKPRVRSSRKSLPTTSTNHQASDPDISEAKVVISEADVHLFHLLHPQPSSAQLPTSNLKIKVQKRRQSEPNHRRSRKSNSNRKLPIFSHPRAVLYRPFNLPELEETDRRRIILSESQEYQVPPYPQSSKKEDKSKGNGNGKEKSENRKPSFVFWDDDDDDQDENEEDDEDDYTIMLNANGVDNEEEEEVEDGPLFPSQSVPNSPDSAEPQLQSTPTHQNTIPQSQLLSQRSSSENYDQLLPSSPIVEFSSPSHLATTKNTKTKKENKKEKKVGSEKEKEKEKKHKKEKKEKNKNRDEEQVDDNNTQTVAVPDQTPTQQTSTPVQNEKKSKRPRESVDGSRKKKKGGPKWVTQTPTQESVQG